MKKLLLTLPLVLLVACTQNQNRENPTGDNETPDLIVSVENATYGGGTAVNVSQADLQINGKTIESTQPYVNIAKHFQMLSEMSINDLRQLIYL